MQTILLQRKILTTATLFALQTACSSSALTGAGISKREKPGTVATENEETTSQTEDSSKENENEYYGTIDNQLISAAYLVCGRDDRTLGCNVYTSSDQRIVRADTEGTWHANVANQSVHRPSARLPKISFVGNLPVTGSSNYVTVSFGISDTAKVNFRSKISNLPPIRALSALGVTESFRVEDNQERLSSQPPSQLSLIGALKETASKKWSFCHDPLIAPGNWGSCKAAGGGTNSINLGGSIDAWTPDTVVRYSIKKGQDEKQICLDVLGIFNSVLCG